MRLRLDKSSLKGVLIAGIVVVAYLLLRRYTGFYIPCLFHSVTGFQCPGCGSTRMLLALMRLDFASAYSYNPFLFVSLPFLAFEFIYEFCFTHDNKTFARINNVILGIYCAAALVFGVMRNLR